MRISQAPSLDVVRASVLTTRGDLVQRGVAVPERLGAGIAEQVLVSNGPGVNLGWYYNNIFHDANAVVYSTVILDIGVWDMDGNPNTTFAHGIADEQDIVLVNVVIHNNDESVGYPLMRLNAATGIVEGGVLNINGIDIDLIRIADGFFDHANFNSPIINRGFCFILYKV